MDLQRDSAGVLGCVAHRYWESEAVRNWTLWLLLVVGCGSVQRPREQAVLPVAIVAWPTDQKPDCEIPELPPAPTLIGHHGSDPLDSQRYFVNARDVAAMVQWNSDVRHVMSLFRQCIRKLVRSP